MATLAINGVLSGIDYDTLVDGLMAAEYVPYTRLDDEKLEVKAQQLATNAIEDAISSLQTQVSKMQNVSTLVSIKGTTSDSNVVGISASSGALPGSHTVTVNQLASSERIVHDAGTEYQTTKVGTGGSISTSVNTNTVADADATWFTTGAEGAVYTFQIGGEDEIEVTFAADTAYSMNEVAALINEASQETFEYDMVSVNGTGPFELAFTAKHRGAGELTATLESGTDIDEFMDAADWNNTDGTDVDAGAFIYTYNGQTRTIYTTADTTLAGLAGLINNDGSNPGVTANIIKHDGTYHLVLAGNKTGADYTITIDDVNTTINGFDSADFTTAQTAQDAEFRIDGYPDPGDPVAWMSSSSNSITDVLPNVTLSLTGEGTTTVNLTKDDSSLLTNVQNLVNSYNNLVNIVDGYTGYDEVTGVSGDLQGDSTIRGILNAIRNSLTRPISGFSSDDGIVMAANIGIEIDKEGQLSLDTEVFNQALKDNYDQVLQFIGADQRGVSDSSYLQFNSALESTKPGTYEVKAEFDGVGTLTGAWIRNEGETEWREATIDGNRITGLTSGKEAGLEVTVTWDGASSSQTHKLRLQQGLAGTVHDVTESLLSSTGPFEIRDDLYDKQLDNLEEKMERLESRLEEKKDRYEAKFSRLEAALAIMQQQSGQFEALFSSLSANKSED